MQGIIVNAISTFILFLFIVLNIFNIFFARNIKDKRIISKSFLTDLAKAEFLLAQWAYRYPYITSLFFKPVTYTNNYINN
jgi:hypothetical protein